MERAVSPVVAIVLLVAITVVGVAAVTSVATGLDDRAAADGKPTLVGSVAAEDQSITIAHRGGATFDLRECSLHVTVAGETLAHQPPVPYFAAEGFRGTPTGPFNSGGDPVFEPGEDATLQLASTNAPHIEAGDRVTVSVRRDGREIARAVVRAS